MPPYCDLHREYHPIGSDCLTNRKRDTMTTKTKTVTLPRPARIDDLRPGDTIVSVEKRTVTVERQVPEFPVGTMLKRVRSFEYGNSTHYIKIEKGAAPWFGLETKAHWDEEFIKRWLREGVLVPVYTPEV